MSFLPPSGNRKRSDTEHCTNYDQIGEILFDKHVPPSCASVMAISSRGDRFIHQAGALLRASALICFQGLQRLLCELQTPGSSAQHVNHGFRREMVICLQTGNMHIILKTEFYHLDCALFLLFKRNPGQMLCG